jgi:glycosyltransferase involved in cell wall biosynthesis
MPLGRSSNGTFEDLELVVVDDGSTDETLDRLKSHQRSEVGPDYKLRHQGVVAAANKAASLAQADWIARMDADDLIPSSSGSRSNGSLPSKTPVRHRQRTCEDRRS